MGSSKAQFTLHTHVTCPAAFKVAHVLSLLGLEYERMLPFTLSVIRNIKLREEKLKWFTALNPNGRSPALIDHTQNDHVVWESTAILLYLVTLYDPEHKLYPKDVFEQSKVNQWMMLQASGQGPTMGQAFWFGYWHHEVLPSAYKRFVDENKRILAVLEKWLMERKWLVDVSYLSWYEEAYWVDADLEEEFPAVHKWLESMKALPEIVAGSVGRQMIQQKKLWERDDYKHDQAS
ncbi:glutathione S-transferase C-terminal-like protein [Exophiala viscosa]|uniref:glutathione S-transferase C-terminal-like protein n=1 Tax=Exophiala viscosa TaxID=2486360 RepID=UPI002192E4E3|nr:glutathione S-transferase C-terminal-like protein [Exophiala viscosa]